MTSPLGMRRNWASMSTTDRNAVIAGFQRAKTSGEYDRLTRLHQTAMLGDANEWHRGPRLLPAHRWFLIQLENAIGSRDIDRAHLRPHVLGDLANDAVEALLWLEWLRHQFAEPLEQNARTRRQVSHRVCS